MNYLILEDNINDLKLLVRQLSLISPTMSYEAVSKKDDFLDKIGGTDLPDVILSDYNLLGYKGTEAFQIMKERGLDIPFILVTGTLEDHVASEVIKLGLDDYILKDRLNRLESSIEAALEKHGLRKQNQEAIEQLRESERRFSSLASVSPVGIFRTDRDGDCIYVNAKYLELTGLTEDEAMAQGWRKAVHPDDLQLVLDSWKGVGFLSENPANVEYRFLHANGKEIWVMGQVIGERDEEGSFQGWVGTITDITDRKLSEQSIKQKEEEFRELFENSIAAKFLVRPSDGLICNANSVACNSSLYGKSGLIRLPFSEVIASGEFSDDWQEILKKKDRGEVISKQWELRRKNGSTYNGDVRVKSITIGGEEQLLFMVLDITDRIKAEQEKKESDRQARELFEQSLEEMYLIDPNGFKIVNTNDTACRAMGYTKAEMLELRLPNIVSGDFSLQYLGQVYNILKGKTELIQGHGKRKDGSTYPIELRVKLVTIGGKKYMLGMGHDITDRLEAEKKKQESEARLGTVLEQAPYGVIITDDQGNIIFYNNATEQMFGYTANETLGNKIEMLLPERFAHNHAPKREGYVAQANPRPLGSGMVFHGKRKNGEEFPIDIMLSSFDRDGKREVMVLLKDITEQFKIEQERKEFTQQLEKQVEERTAELKETNLQLEESNRDIKDSILYAERLQKAVLPELDTIKEVVDDVFIMYRPRDIVSGDFYWYHVSEKDTVVVSADCTGHGVPGAFMSIMGIELLQKIVVDQDVRRPSLILELLNDGLINTLQKAGDYSLGDGMDVSICRVDHARGVLDFGGAGASMIHISEGELTSHKNGRFGLGSGLRRKVAEFSDTRIELQKGDMIYLFSDGYPDQFGGPQNRKVLMGNFRNLLMEGCQKPLKEQQKQLEDYFDKWKGDGRQVDDVMVIGLRM